MSQLLTTKQLQNLLKIDRVTVYRMLNDGRLKGVKVGNQWRFPQSEINRLLGQESQPVDEKESEAPISDFPVDCVQKLQEVFAGILGIGAVTTSLEGEPLTAVHNSNPFCKLMLSSPAGKQGCQASWRKISLRATGDGACQVCHAGLCYTRAVIQMDDKPVANLIAGQFYLEKPDPAAERERLERLSLRYQIPLAQLIDAAPKIPQLKRSQLAQVQEWAPKVALTVQSMLCERSDLMSRLQRIASLSSVQQTLPKSNIS